MRGFLDDLERSKRKHRPEKLNDFRKVLEQVAVHASESYFILKSIIVDNLYGVDIMAEAVEICKLRLFLKLVAQLESYEQIEPLPDVDFNVRAGNTLVGFTSLEKIRKALTITSDGQRRILYPEDEAELRRLEEDAEIADRAFHRFREMQTGHDMDASKFSAAKLELRKRLDGLRDELDRYLASEYGVEDTDRKAYEQWQNSHQPFHWFAEFYGIMRSGGFDVIIGNPPYVEYNKVKGIYAVRGYETESCGNLYAFVVERSFEALNKEGGMGMIVQLSISCTERMTPIQDKCLNQSCNLWFAHFDDRPAKLFDGLQHIRATIILAQKGFTRSRGGVQSTLYSRWPSVARSHLFETLAFTNIDSLLGVVTGSIPKVGQAIGAKVIQRILDDERLHLKLLRGHGKLYYHNSPQYWIRAMDFAPYFWNERDGEQISSHVKRLIFENMTDASVAVAVLNSSLFYWWFLLLSDCRDLNLREIENFPVGLDRMSDSIKKRLVDLSKRLMASFRQNSQRKETRYQTTGRVIYDEFNQKPSKPIVDVIDHVLAEHYGFTDEELDFIINYDIKYRMGRN